MGEGGVGDDDGGAGADAEGEDGPVFGLEFADNRLELRGGFEEE